MFWLRVTESLFEVGERGCGSPIAGWRAVPEAQQLEGALLETAAAAANAERELQEILDRSVEKAGACYRQERPPPPELVQAASSALRVLRPKVLSSHPMLRWSLWHLTRPWLLWS